MKSAAKKQTGKLRVSKEIQDQLKDLLRQSEYRCKEQRRQFATLDAAVKHAQKQTRSCQRLLQESEAAHLDAQQTEKRLFDKVAVQRSVMFDLRCEVAGLKDQLRAAEAEHWRAVATAAVEQASCDVAHAEARAEKGADTAQQSAQWAAEDYAKQSKQDGEYISRLLDKVSEQQVTEKVLKEGLWSWNTKETSGGTLPKLNSECSRTTRNRL